MKVVECRSALDKVIPYKSVLRVCYSDVAFQTPLLLTAYFAQETKKCYFAGVVV